MLPDQLVVDRAYGGRFQPKNGWKYVLEKGKAWDILVDTHPETNGAQGLHHRRARLRPTRSACSARPRTRS